MQVAKTLFGALIASCLALPAAAETVGRAAAVNPTSTGQPPGGTQRTLKLGSDVVHRERVVTTSSGSLQILFVDSTTINIGPNSDLVIDDFVYRPGGGRMAATLTKGVLRFVGGQISHGEGASIRTPVATIGIRGGVASVRHGRLGSEVTSGFGVITVTSAKGSTVLSRPGFTVQVAPDGTIGTVTRVAQASVDAVLAETLSRGRQTGGAARRPNDILALNAGLGQTNRNLDRCLQPLQPRLATQPPPAACEALPDRTLELHRLVQDGAQLGQRVSADIITQPTVNPTGPSGPIILRQRP